MTNELLTNVQLASQAFDRIVVARVKMLDRVSPSAKKEIFNSMADGLEAAGFETGLNLPEDPGGSYEFRICKDVGFGDRFDLLVEHKDLIGLFRKVAKLGQKQFRELEKHARFGDE